MRKHTLKLGKSTGVGSTRPKSVAITRYGFYRFMVYPSGWRPRTVKVPRRFR